jgi:hypothetical protein
MEILKDGLEECQQYLENTRPLRLQGDNLPDV